MGAQSWRAQNLLWARVLRWAYRFPIQTPLAVYPVVQNMMSPKCAVAGGTFMLYIFALINTKREQATSEQASKATNASAYRPRSQPGFSMNMRGYVSVTLGAVTHCWQLRPVAGWSFKSWLLDNCSDLLHGIRRLGRSWAVLCNIVLVVRVFHLSWGCVIMIVIVLPGGVLRLPIRTTCHALDMHAALSTQGRTIVDVHTSILM